MAQVSNATTSPIVLGLTRIDPGGSAEVPDWDTWKENAQVAAWIETGALVEGELPEPEEGDDESLPQEIDTNRVSEADYASMKKLGQPLPSDYREPPGDEEPAPKRSRRRPASSDEE